jgi:formylglycine-generating enzyme required for sulfatase activity
MLPNGAPIYAQRYEVTIREWTTCVAQKGCTLALGPRPDQDPATTPATGFHYHLDVQE